MRIAPVANRVLERISFTGAAMSGHNRWTKIKRKKEAMGATKGALFTKLIREVTVAARTGGGDPDHNARLRSAVLAAREANMPSETIQRAIKKGTGELEGVSYEEMVYEGYGPGGVAIVCEVLTDNKNRTAGDVRAIFAKSGGSMATTGAVAFQFERKGVIPVKKGPSEEQVMELALDAGADDVVADDEGGFEVRTDASSLMRVHNSLEGKLPAGAPRMVYLPKTTVQVSGDAAEKVIRLVENLEENDDVQHVYTNVDVDEGTLRELESRA
jgi:YebC/PmpR family DNA-binding regulatory protein